MESASLTTPPVGITNVQKLEVAKLLANYDLKNAESYFNEIGGKVTDSESHSWIAKT